MPRATPPPKAHSRVDGADPLQVLLLVAHVTPPMYRENVRHLLKGVFAPRRRRLVLTPARQLVTGQASRPRPVDDVNDDRELPPNHTDDETPSSRRNSNALSRRWASSSSLRRSLNRPSLYPQNADPPACQTSPRRRAAGRRNTPPSAGHGRATFRTISCRGIGTVPTMPRRCASVDGALACRTSSPRPAAFPARCAAASFFF